MNIYLQKIKKYGHIAWKSREDRIWAVQKGTRAAGAGKTVISAVTVYKTGLFGLLFLFENNDDHNHDYGNYRNGGYYDRYNGEGGAVGGSIACLRRLGAGEAVASLLLPPVAWPSSGVKSLPSFTSI